MAAQQVGISSRHIFQPSRKALLKTCVQWRLTSLHAVLITYTVQTLSRPLVNESASNALLPFMQKHTGHHQPQQQHQRAISRAGRSLRRAAFCGSSCDDKDTPLAPIHLQPSSAAGRSFLRSSLTVLTLLHLRCLGDSLFPTTCQPK